MRYKQELVASVILAVSAMAQAHVAQAESCGNSQPWTYHAQPEDTSTATSLDVRRPFQDVRSLHLEVCSGELRIVGTPSGNGLHLQVTSSGAGKPLGSFLQTFSMENNQAMVRLQLPKNANAVVTLYVPYEEADAEIDLGAGRMRLRGDALRGHRKLNIGAGSAYLELNGHRDYSELKANIGMGHLSDSRPGEHDGFLVVSRNLQGTGQGLIEINVGAGNINLVPSD